MDIMMRLKGAGFSVIANEFRQRERRLGTGLPLQDFVEIVLQGLPKPKTPEEKYANISALVDLFEDMDINGDGTMEFDEFTSYCVDAGMVATRTKTANLKHRYVRNARHVIKTKNGSIGIEKVRWSALFQRFLVLENAAKSVKIFNADGYMVGDVRSQSTLLNAPPVEDHEAHAAAASRRANEADGGSPAKHATRANESDTTAASTPTSAGDNGPATAGANAGIFILDAVFLHKFQCLAMSTTDFVISFYNMEEPKHKQRLPADMLAATARSGPSYDVLPKLTITTSTAQLLLRFCEEAGLLFSAGNDFIVNVWKIEDLETKTLWKRLMHHQGMIMDIMEIPMHDMIVSCDLNHTMQLWDIHDCRPRGSLVGHTRGIKQMVFSKDHDMLLTAGFEFDAYGWDIASRQVVMKLVGHRAPLIGVQLALFQTERAVTADASGVFKVWDISRATGSTSHSTSSGMGARQSGRGASHAVLLESLDPTHELSRFEPTTFISLHPQRRDIWTAASGSATLHLFRSTRVQQFDEIPLKAFYHYNANRFVVISGPVCSIWDGETGTCIDEFNHVGSSIGSSRGDRASAHQSNNSTATSSHNGSVMPSGMEASTDILLCVQDSKCKKLVVLSEDGEMGVLNSQNFVQMRRCEEKFHSLPSRFELARGGNSSSLPPPSCGIIGLHYCSENKLIIATDSHNSSICVIDDSNSDSANGIKETIVLRRLVHVPGGIAASAYSYHASMIATLDQETHSKISLWDFETLVSVGTCQMDEADIDAGSRLSVLTFWDEYPVLLGGDLQGAVYFFAVMPTAQAKTGTLLHAFINDHTLTNANTTQKDSGSPGDSANNQGSTEESNQSTTFITEGAESAARKFLLKHKKSTASRKTLGSVSEASKDTNQPQQSTVLGGVVTCMQVISDQEDEQHRFLLFTGDEKGVIRVWNLNDMMRRLSLFKIPETSCKYLRRGYHPRAMFAHDCTKQANVHRSDPLHDTASVLAGEVPNDTRARISQAQLKRLTKQRADAKKRASNAQTSQLAKLLPANRVLPGHAPPSATTVAAAEAFLVANSSARRSTSMLNRTASFDASAVNTGGAIIQARSRPAENRRRSDCWQNQDVTIANVWVAHADGITSLEVSKHPNIVVSCSLDMRVYVWNWQGACLGKLFDAENMGIGRWRFRKDNTKRNAEREFMIDELIRDLELPPQEKAHRRRHTLYQSHVQRKSQKELPHVSVMLLDHIVSQHPEVVAMEKEGLSNASTDEKINAEMERTRMRNYRAKVSMLEAITRASTGPASTRTKDIVRMHSLAQVGPLLCVDKFEMKQELQQMKFTEKEELVLDRQYLEEELGVGSSDSDLRRGSLKAGNLAFIKDQIRSAHRHAEHMMENKIALQRHALSMYSNLHQGQRKTPQHAHESMLLAKQTGINPLGDDRDRSGTANELEQMLAPSPFLQGKLPERFLSMRPQTAPTPKLSTSLPRTMSSSSVRTEGSHRAGSAEVRRRRQQLGPLSSSASESSLGAQSVRSVDVAKTNRKCSLDQMYLEELRRQNRSPTKRLSLSEVQQDSTIPEEGEGDQSSDPGPLQKLIAINSIIDMAQGACDANVKTAKEARSIDYSHLHARPSTAPSSSSVDEMQIGPQRSVALPTLVETEDLPSDENARGEESREQDENDLRSHLDATRRRMEVAMEDSQRGGERALSGRSVINKKREEVAHQKKGKRMEDYLQQKRRELNTNIGAVFKRTSFAFPSAGATMEGVTSDGERIKKKLQKGTHAATAVVDHRALQAAQTKVEKSKVFGIYGVKEVMSIIRLFWSMDDDCSGSLSLAELLTYKTYFEKLGYHDMTTVFQAIDKDGSGNISLKELLEICFQYATKYQIEEMLKLAKLGDVASYFDATHSHRAGAKKGEMKPEEKGQNTTDEGKSKDHLSAEERAELLAIFRVFDRNGDGGIGMDEIMEALHVEEDEMLVRITAAEEAQLAKRDAATGGNKRRSSIAVASAPRRNTSAFTKEEVRKFYEDVDTDGDRSLNFEEFVVLMQMLHGPRR